MGNSTRVEGITVVLCLMRCVGCICLSVVFGLFENCFPFEIRLFWPVWPVWPVLPVPNFLFGFRSWFVDVTAVAGLAWLAGLAGLAGLC